MNKPTLHKDGTVTFDNSRVVGLWHQEQDGNHYASGFRGNNLPNLVAHTKAELRQQIARQWMEMDDGTGRD